MYFYSYFFSLPRVISSSDPYQRAVKKCDEIVCFFPNKPGAGTETAESRAACKAPCHTGDADAELALGKQTLWHMYTLEAKGLPLMFSLPAGVCSLSKPYRFLPGLRIALLPDRAETTALRKNLPARRAALWTVPNACSASSSHRWCWGLRLPSCGCPEVAVLLPQHGWGGRREAEALPLCTLAPVLCKRRSDPGRSCSVVWLQAVSCWMRELLSVCGRSDALL